MSCRRELLKRIARLASDMLCPVAQNASADSPSTIPTCRLARHVAIIEFGLSGS